MRRLTTRDRAVPCRARRGGSVDRTRAGALRRRPGARRRALAVPALGRRQRAARQEGPLPRRRRDPPRGAPGRRRSTSTRPRRRGRSRRAPRVKPDGTFVARWKPRRIGTFRTRALVGREAQAASASPELTLTVFRPAIATWYGPGFYGNTTACGLEMTEELVGVAHRSLPCGTNVAVRYGSRTLVVPVVDRGPFGGEAKWDLTAAAAQQLGFDRDGSHRRDPPRPARLAASK